MLIAITMALLLSGIILITHEEETPESLITAIKTGAPSKRWQKAFELSNELNREGGMLRSAGIMNEAIHILRDQEHYDPKTRAYMAMALSRFQNEEAQAALVESLHGTDDSEDPQFTLFLIWAIGNSNLVEAAPNMVRFLESRHDDLRKASAYVLGALGDKEIIPNLERALEDPVADVRWNAALSLARLGDNSGEGMLREMLDRNRLGEVYGLNPIEIERVMTNAAKGLGLLERLHEDHEASISRIQLLEQISRTDLSLKVRQAAISALEYAHS